MPADLDTAVHGGISSQHYGLRNSFGLPVGRHKLDWIDANVADGEPDYAGLQSLTSRKRESSNLSRRDRGEYHTSSRPASIYEPGGAAQYIDRNLTQARQEVRRQTPGRLDGNLRASQLQLDALSEIRASRSEQLLRSTRKQTAQVIEAVDNRRAHAAGDSVRLELSRRRHDDGLELSREQALRLRDRLSWSLASNEDEDDLANLPARISASVSDPERDAALTRLAQSLIEIGKVQDGEDILRAMNLRNDPRHSARSSLRHSQQHSRPGSVYVPPYRPGSIAGLDELDPRLSAAYEYQPKVIGLETRDTTRRLEQLGLLLPSSDPLIRRTPMEDLFDRLYGNRGNMQGELERERISARLDTVELVNAKWGNRVAHLLGSSEPASRVYKASVGPGQDYTGRPGSYPPSSLRSPEQRFSATTRAADQVQVGGAGEPEASEMSKAASRGWDSAMRLSKLLEDTEGRANGSALRASPPSKDTAAITGTSSNSVLGPGATSTPNLKPIPSRTSSASGLASPRGPGGHVQVAGGSAIRTTPRSASASGAGERAERWTVRASERGSELGSAGFSSKETVERLLGRKAVFLE